MNFDANFCMDVYSNKCWGTAKFRSISNNSRLSTGTNRRKATCHGTRGGSDNNLAYTTNFDVNFCMDVYPNKCWGTPKFRSIPNNPLFFDRNAWSIGHVPPDETRERQHLGLDNEFWCQFLHGRLSQQMLRDCKVSEHFQQSSIFWPDLVLHRL